MGECSNNLTVPRRVRSRPPPPPSSLHPPPRNCNPKLVKESVARNLTPFPPPTPPLFYRFATYGGGGSRGMRNRQDATLLYISGLRIPIDVGLEQKSKIWGGSQEVNNGFTIISMYLLFIALLHHCCCALLGNSFDLKPCAFFKLKPLHFLWRIFVVFCYIPS